MPAAARAGSRAKGLPPPQGSHPDPPLALVLLERLSCRLGAAVGLVGAQGKGLACVLTRLCQEGISFLAYSESYSEFTVWD